jgi:hypothetical protein
MQGHGWLECPLGRRGWWLGYTDRPGSRLKELENRGRQESQA